MAALLYVWSKAFVKGEEMISEGEYTGQQVIKE